MTIGDREQRDEPWLQAREAARADVAAALAPRERPCPACGTANTGPGRTCSNCGADLTARHAKPRKWRRAGIGVLALLVLAVAAFPLVSALRDDAAGERARQAERQAAAEAAERARLTREARPVRASGPSLPAGADPLAHRSALVRLGEQRIAADARARVAAGTLDGDIQGADCRPFPPTEARRAAERSPALRAGRYDCVAYTAQFEPPEDDGRVRTGLFGYPFRLVIDYSRSRLVWCKLNPPPSEGAKSLSRIRMPAPCGDPPGPG